MVCVAGPRLWTSVAALAALMGLAACSDAARLEAGAPCGGDGACASGFCDRVCREASGDDDGDGLDNATERGLGSDPDGLDSDRDGIVDALEATGDADQDGRPDILESALVDADRDCLPAQLDPDEASPEQDGAVLARALCRRAGVCAEGPGAVTARCETLVVDGAELAQVVCEYDKIAGFEAGVETSCDGRDNDCDGHTDEDLGTIDSTGLVRALGDDCVGTGACASRVGVVECDPGGRAVCSVDAGGSAAPSVTDDVDCDAIDNDCDGQTDEGVAWMDPRSGQLLRFGEPCAGLGACGLAQGVVECAADAARGVCSTEPGGSGDLAAPESCNGLDDDCDGRTDEGLVWIGPDGKPRGIGESCGVGRCRGGQVVCGAGAAVCSTAALAQPELCNGEDDDCDGASDEPEDLTNACPALGLCAKLSLSRVSCDGPSGVVSCTFDPPGQVEAYETRCNGEDDDCDGQTDEDLAPRDGEPLGATCTGRGACADTTGTVVCDADGVGTRCSADVGAADERCNGVDDDCDGATDEAPLEAPPACAGAGVCADYSQVPAACVGGAWRCAFVADAAWQEVETQCDDLDNDCDGQTDEGLGRVPAGTWSLLPGRSPPDRLSWPVASAPIGPLLFGGVARDAMTHEPVLLGDLWRYDADHVTWERLGAAGAPSPRAGHALAWEPEHAVLVVHGGFTTVAGLGALGPDGAPVGSMFVYDPASATWSIVSEDFGLLAPALFARRFHALVALGDGRLALVGGLPAGVDGSGVGALGEAAPLAIGTLAVDGGAWRCAWSVPPTAALHLAAWRFGHGAALADGRLVIAGGRALGGAAAVGIALTALDGVGDATVELAPDLEAIGDFPAVLAVDDQHVIVAGQRGLALEAHDDGWSASAIAGPVPLSSGLPVGRGGALARGAGASAAVYLLEGTTAAGDSGRRTFALEAGGWGPGVAWDAPPPRIGASLVSDPSDGDIYLLGGVRALGGGPLQDAWRWDAAQSRWRGIVPASSPGQVDALRPALARAAVVWDPNERCALLWDGSAAGLWAFDGLAYAAIANAGDGPAPGDGRWVDAGALFAMAAAPSPANELELWRLTYSRGDAMATWSQVPPPEVPVVGALVVAGRVGSDETAVVQTADAALVVAWDGLAEAWLEPRPLTLAGRLGDGPAVWDTAHQRAFVLAADRFDVIDVVAGTVARVPLSGQNAPLAPALTWLGEPATLMGFGGIHTSSTSLDRGPASARTFLFDLECAP